MNSKMTFYHILLNSDISSSIFFARVGQGHCDLTGNSICFSITDVPAWLKSLRLHKYASLFSQMTYEEMMILTEQHLESQVSNLLFLLMWKLAFFIQLSTLLTFRSDNREHNCHQTWWYIKSQWAMKLSNAPYSYIRAVTHMNSDFCLCPFA